jgi:AraC-like DNA-binding protein
MKRISQSTYFYKSLSILLLITSLPLFLIAAGSYYFGIGEIGKQVHEAHQIRLQEVTRGMDEKLAQLEALMNRWALNSVFDQKLRQYSPDTDYDVTRELYDALNLLNGSHPLISKVYVFMEEKRLLVSSETGVMRIKNEEDYQRYRHMMEVTKGFGWVTGKLPQGSKGELVNTSLVYKLPYYLEQPYGAFVVHISENEMQSVLRQLNPDENGVSLIVDGKGNRITDYGNVEGKRALLQFLDGGKPEAPFQVQKLLKEQYAISSGVISHAGWTYITATPLNDFTKRVSFTSKWILGTSLFSMAFAAILSWFASRKMYQPIRRLVQLVRGDKEGGSSAEDGDEMTFIENQWNGLNRESRGLQERLEQSLPAMRKSFLLQLIEGHFYFLSESNLRERLEHYGWEIEDQFFSVHLVQLSGFSGLEGKFSEGDEQLVTFAAANILEELAGAVFPQMEVINFQDLTVGLLVGLPVGTEAAVAKRMVQTFFQESMVKLHTLLRMNITVSIGRWSGQIRATSSTLEELRSSLRYKEVDLNVQFIDAETLVARGHDCIYYPFQLEKGIMYAVRMGHEEEAVRLTVQFMQDMMQHVKTEGLLLQGAHQLLGNIQYVVLQAGFDTSRLYQGANLHEELLAVKNSNEFVPFLCNRVIEPYMRELRERIGQQARLLIEKVTEYMNHSYPQDLSLESCAERFQTNPFQLSRSFKHVLGVTFVDYLTELRLEKTKALLASTNLKINEIADQVGYQHTYLNRIFKKYFGMTPTQYREKFQ